MLRYGIKCHFLQTQTHGGKGVLSLNAELNKVRQEMLKILQARFQQYVNQELPDVQDGLRKGRGTRGQIADIHWIIEKAREFQKNIYFCFIDYTKAFDCVHHNKLENSSRDGNTRPLYPASWEICMQIKKQQFQRTGHGTTDWFQNGKGVHQSCVLSPCLFKLYAEYIMQNARLDEAQVEIKISGRNINNLRYADDTTLMAENE